MANVNPITKPKAFTLRVDQEFIDLIERARELMRPVPTKSDAIRAALANEVARLEKQSRAERRKGEQ